MGQSATGTKEYRIITDGNTNPADDFWHPGGELQVTRKDDAATTAGTTKLQFDLPKGTGDYDDINDGVNTTEMTESSIKRVFVGPCRIRINTAGLADGGVNITLTSIPTGG